MNKEGLETFISCFSHGGEV